MSRSTHTYAALEISAAAYDEIAGLLRAAGYDHAFDSGSGAIDMHGIGLVRGPRATAPTPTSEQLSAMNGALCSFSMRWAVDGDYMRCRKCKRPHIASRADLAFVHAEGCKAAGEVETHPWRTFQQLLAPLQRADVGSLL